MNVIFRWCNIILTYQEDESQKEGEERSREGGGGYGERGVQKIQPFKWWTLLFLPTTQIYSFLTKILIHFLKL